MTEKQASPSRTKRPSGAQPRKSAKRTVSKRRLRTRLTKEQIQHIFTRFHKQDEAPRTELEHTNPYTLLVAVTLSAQATDVGVNRATRELFKIVDTPQKMVALGEDRLRDYIKTIGLYRNKARNVVALSQILIDEHDGEVPEDRDILETLPGVGRKTANVVMNEAFGHPTMAVDTHIFRVSNRTGLAPGKNPLEVEELLLRVVPEPFQLHAHHWLILHGRYICLARKPKCWCCPISEQCKFKDKTPDPADETPAPKKTAHKRRARKTASETSARRKPTKKRPAPKQTKGT